MTVSDRPDSLDRPTPRRLPGDIHMWVMILGDLFVFGCYFVVYMIFRAVSPHDFSASQRHLQVGIGVTNTVILLTSSMFVALAVIAVRETATRRAERLVLAACVCGLMFTLIKIYEWRHGISTGFTLSDEFFSFYYVLTGIHLAHLLLGMLILGIVVRELRVTRKPRVGLVEQGALFWHMIDLLWVVIFALLYLMK
ncbi:cytochrome c oxidase subunit 3 [Nocardia barduliensis]|uniref:cytochrome c oxidase subunit 3 n=1 Tax=Nocardia barduliensis TaxID=2736643 RepID=UPI0015739105|nr:cytochrome c oxidase subunit 3 [Nocardia barduliensis]